MRLINTEDLSVRDFQGTEIPEYAILSHRWEDGEVTFRELVEAGSRTLSEPAIRQRKRAGWRKLHTFRTFARNRGHQYVWLDTCCIDKTSSAELSEAINSMYGWYAKATVCYTYLCDVPSKKGLSSPRWSQIFRSSMIWSRGWTLQELLAPEKVVFICSDWSEEVGTKESLSADVSKAASIPESIVRSYPGCTLTRPGYSDAATVAEIMSWASTRVCTRIEDSAYSLMGLFGISMPLLYGEGDSAFLRLQLEIISRTDDESIFAWSGVDETTGLLAPFVSYFQRFRHKTFQLTEWDPQRPPYAMTNKGLRFEPLLCLYEAPEHPMIEKWVMPLNVNVSSSSSSQGLAVLLTFRSNGITASRSGWFDLIEHNYTSDDERFERRTIFIQQSWAPQVASSTFSSSSSGPNGWIQKQRAAAEFKASMLLGPITQE